MEKLNEIMPGKKRLLIFNASKAADRCCLPCSFPHERVVGLLLVT